MKRNNIEVGKSYKGLINGVVFKVVRVKPPRPQDLPHSSTYYEICLQNGNIMYVSEYILDYALIEEVK